MMCTGGVMPCAMPSDCPATGNDCVTATCDMGCCGTTTAADGTLTATGQTTGDCQKRVCTAGVAGMANDDADPPANMDECHKGYCNAGAPTQTPDATDTLCTSGGGKFCADPTGPNAGKCVECNADAQCAGVVGKPLCQSNACAPLTCNNGVQDASNGETDVDCGGTVCGTCANASKCLVDGDCTHGFCDSTLHCATPTCSDTAKNGNETDVNCGGTGFQGAGACPPCANALKCGVNADCTSGFCDQMVTPHICKAPSCTDGQKNGTELGVDCGGATCDALGKTCAVGGPCNTAADCTSGFCQGATCALKPIGTACGVGAECSAPSACIDGVCCDTAACNGTCQACSATTKGQGADGVCGGVKVGTDAKNQCASSAQSTCGNDGSCDGTGSNTAPGACEKWSMATTCAAASCTGSTLTATRLCDGSGTCNAPMTSSCGAYNCNAGGTACLTACTLDTQCTAGNYCNGTACVPTKAPGVACSKNSACVSGVCGTTGSGTCCVATCNTINATCGATACASGTGACSYPTAGTTGASCKNSCLNGVLTPGSCNGSGSCTTGTAATCAGGFTCANVAACKTACAGDTDCQLATTFCANPGASGTCVNKLATGVACTANNQCTSNMCDVGNTNVCL
jgi:hypothetical protein